MIDTIRLMKKTWKLSRLADISKKKQTQWMINPKGLFYYAQVTKSVILVFVSILVIKSSIPNALIILLSLNSTN